MLSLLFCMLLLVVPFGSGRAEKPAPGSVQKALYWSGEGGSPQMVVVDRGSGRYRLLVVGGGPVEVTYRTERNSSVPVAEVLEPLDTAIPGVGVYEFRHSFSRTTVWMALEFSRDGRVVEELGRTFYGSLGGVK